MALNTLNQRASIAPLTVTSLVLTILGCLLVISIAVVGFIYWRKRRQVPSSAQAPKSTDDRSSSAGSEEHQLENIIGSTNNSNAQTNRYSVGIMSRVSNAARSPRPARSPGPNNRYSVGMLSRVSMDPSVSSPKPDRDRSRSRTREERDRAYARLSMGAGVMSRPSKSPGPRSPMSPRDPLMSAGIMSRMSMAPPSPMPRNLSAAPSPVLTQGGNDFLEPPPRYS